MEKSSFFNAQLVGEEYDRVYLAEDYAKYFSTFIGNGIFPNPSTNCQVLANTDNMYIKLSSGLAWINGYMYWNTDVLNILIAPADGVLNRIDRVVLRLDFVNREIKCYVKEGDFASSPVAKELTRNADMYELGIADIYVTKGAIKITQANVTDLRLNSNYCGVVHGVVDQVNVTTMFNQYSTQFSEAETEFETTISNAITQFTTDFNTWFTTNTTDWSTDFTDWFNNVKATLSGDIAANLQSEIDAINTALGGKSDTNHTHNYAGSNTPGGAATTSLACTGNSATATKLATARTINGINFDGSTNINNYASTSGTSTAYTCTITGASYVNGLEITILPHADCGANATLNVNSLGALTIKNSSGETLKAGDIKAGVPVSLVRVGSYFFIRGGGGKAKPNIFVQATEPTTKDGIWIKKDAAYDGIIELADQVYFDSSVGYVANNPIPFSFDSYGRAVAIGTNIYLFGSSSTGYTKYAYKYSTITNTYTRLADIPVSFAYGSVVAIGTDIFLLGDYTNHTYVYKYNTTDGTYTRLKDIPYEFYYGKAVSVGADIYLFGTYETGYEKYAYKYSTITNTYTRLADNPQFFQKGDAILYGTDIYLFCVTSAANEYNYKYSTIDGTYTKLAIFPTDQWSGSAALLGTDVYLFESNTYLYKYSITTNTYTKLTDAPYYFKTAITVNDYIYLLSGYDNPTYNYKYGAFIFSPNKIIFKANSCPITFTVKLHNTDYALLNKFKFDNVFLTGSDGKNTNALCYYGTGTAWVQI